MANWHLVKDLPRIAHHPNKAGGIGVCLKQQINGWHTGVWICTEPAPPCLWWCLKIFSCLGKIYGLFQTSQDAATQGCSVQDTYTEGSQDISVVFYAHLCPPNYRHLIVMWGLVCGSMAKCEHSQQPRQVFGNTDYGCDCTIGLVTAKGSAGWQGKKHQALFFHAYTMTSTRCADVHSTLGNK